MIPEPQSTSAESAPRKFSEIPRLWLQLANMTDAFFQEEVRHTSVSNTLIGILIVSGVTALASIASALLDQAVSAVAAQPSSAEPLIPLGVSAGLLPLCGLLLAPIGFYTSTALEYGVARLFGGKGTFSAQAYLTSLYYVPLGVISAAAGLFSAVPYIGLAVLPLALLGIVVVNVIWTIRVLRVVHTLSTGRAVAAYFLPVVLVLVPLCLLFVVMAISMSFLSLLPAILPTPGGPIL